MYVYIKMFILIDQKSKKRRCDGGNSGNSTIAGNSETKAASQSKWNDLQCIPRISYSYIYM